MTRDNELGTLLKAAFEEEVAAMAIDTRAGLRRLERELDESARSRPRRRALIAATVLLAAVLAGWATWSTRPAVAPSAPPHPSTSSSTMTLVPSSEAHLLDLRTGATTLPPEWLRPKDVGDHGEIKPRPGTRSVAVLVCTPDCGGQVSVLIGSLDDRAMRTIRLPAGLSPLGLEWAPDGQKLGFWSTDDPLGVPEFYVLDLGTERVTKVTDISLDKVYWVQIRGGFSADGTAVIYDLPRTRDEFTGWDIWKKSVSGGPATILLRDALAPEPMPGTASIAFISPDPGSWGGNEIHVADADGKRRLLVRTPSEVTGMDASPDGTRLAINDEGSSGLSIVDVATGQLTRIGPGSPNGWVDDSTLLVGR